MQGGRCEARKGGKERKTSGVKTFSELARPLTRPYVPYASVATECGHIPHHVRPLNCHFQHALFAEVEVCERWEWPLNWEIGWII